MPQEALTLTTGLLDDVDGRGSRPSSSANSAVQHLFDRRARYFSPDEVEQVRVERLAMSHLVKFLIVAVAAIALLGGASAASNLLLDEPTRDAASPRREAEGPNLPLLRANEFATEINTYAGTDLADYRQRVVPLLTARYATDFEARIAAFVSATKRPAEKQRRRRATVASSEIKAAGTTSATVLVVVNVEATRNDRAAPRGRTLRWNVNLVRLGDQWRVSGYEAKRCP